MGVDTFSNSENSASIFGKNNSLTQSTQKEETHGWNTASLVGLLNDADVLLGERCSISNLFKGTSLYWQKIKEHRQMYYDTRGSPQQLRLVQRVVESVWERDGRFLAFDKRNGHLLLVPNKTVMSQVRQDFKAGKPIVHEITIKEEKKGAKKCAKKSMIKSTPNKKKVVKKATATKSALITSDNKKKSRPPPKRKNQKRT